MLTIEFAKGKNIPRRKPPRTGPLTTPKMVTAAVITPGTFLITNITTNDSKPYIMAKP